MHGIHGRGPALATGIAAARDDLSHLARHRRRRRAVDRRQPPHPRAAPQRPGQDPALQQPDLRPHQGPGVADLRARQGDEVDAVRLRSTGRSTRSSLALGAEATLRRPHGRHRQAAPARDAPRRRRARGRGADRDLPELPRLQRRRVRRAARQEGRTRSTRSASSTASRSSSTAAPSRSSGTATAACASPTPATASRSIHDAHRDDPILAFALSRLSLAARTGPTPIGIFRSVERPVHGAGARRAGRAPDDGRARRAARRAATPGPSLA